MARGGKRPGAGRKPGKPSVAKRLREESVRVLQDGGVTPLAVILTTMRALWGKATEKAGEIDLKYARGAAELAKDAAPFVHPKLAQVDMTARGAVKVTKAVFVMSQDGKVVQQLPMDEPVPEEKVIEGESKPALPDDPPA